MHSPGAPRIIRHDQPRERIVYRRSDENIERLVVALAPYAPYLRGAPVGLPFEWSAATLRHGLNVTLTTEIGDIALFGEIAGGGRYEDLIEHSETIVLFGQQCRCVDLSALIRLKRAAGRPGISRFSRSWKR